MLDILHKNKHYIPRRIRGIVLRCVGFARSPGRSASIITIVVIITNTIFISLVQRGPLPSPCTSSCILHNYRPDLSARLLIYVYVCLGLRICLCVCVHARGRWFRQIYTCIIAGGAAAFRRLSERSRLGGEF